MTTIQRRQFLQQVQAAAGAGAFMSFSGLRPQLLQQAAQAAESKGDDRVLVVVQLSGGNDGLNTIVPFRNDDYAKNRPTLAVAETSVLRLNDELGMHPSLSGLFKHYQKDRVSVIQGVGYEDPNRSHFESMDIWHTCRRKGETRNTGWLGRCCDQWGSQDGDVPGIHLGENKQPLALAAERSPAPSISSLETFQLQNAPEAFQDAVRQAAGASADDPLLSFIQSNTSSALEASRRIRAAAEKVKSAIEYPDYALATKLKTVAQLIGAGMKTKVYYVELDGFDTHSEQEGAHASLLRKWSAAMDAFLRDLEAQGNHQRVLTMCFSEFGRRVAENASKGTDHGAAGPMFLIGEPVKGGLVGELPSITDLVQGDLKHHTDFRQVYATVLEDWLGVSSEPVLQGRYQSLDLLAS